MADAARDLARRLTDAVLALDGVQSLFGAPLLTGLAVLDPGPGARSLVEVSRVRGRWEVTVRLASTTAVPARDLSRAIAAAVRAEVGRSPFHVAVEFARIQPMP